MTKSASATNLPSHNLRPDGDRARTEWSRLFAEWLRVQARLAELEAAEVVSEEESDAVKDREADLVTEICKARPPLAWQVAEKAQILEHYMNGMGEWGDRRDELLLASLRRDIEAL